MVFGKCKQNTQPTNKTLINSAKTSFSPVSIHPQISWKLNENNTSKYHQHIFVEPSWILPKASRISNTHLSQLPNSPSKARSAFEAAPAAPKDLRHLAGVRAIHHQQHPEVNGLLTGGRAANDAIFLWESKTGHPINYILFCSIPLYMHYIFFREPKGMRIYEKATLKYLRSWGEKNLMKLPSQASYIRGTRPPQL